MNNNTPPFEVVYITTKNNKNVMVKPLIVGRIYTVIEIDEYNGGLIYKISGHEFSINGYEAWYVEQSFAPLPPSYENIASELAAAAMNVGDTADQPVKEIVKN